MDEEIMPAFGITELILKLSNRMAAAATRPLFNGKLYFHVKHKPPTINTMGKLQEIYSKIINTRNASLIGLEPECVTDWNSQLTYLSECKDIPIMLTVFSSDGALKLSLSKIEEAMSAANVTCLRFHEVISYYGSANFPVGYARSIIALAKARNIPVFWNEWNIYTHQQISDVITGFENNVMISFGTNSNQVEPQEGYRLLQRFKRKAASVQSWYWWERHGRANGTEMQMPPELMVQHTREAFQAGCELVQYEPSWYFFNNENPKPALSAVLKGL